MNNVVVFTVSDRPEYLTKTLDSWSKVRGTDDVLFLFMVEPMVSDVMLQIVNRFEVLNKQVYVNEVRLGVLNNPYVGLWRAFEDHAAQYAMVAEEDIVVSSDILEYNEYCRNEFMRRGDILAICSSHEYYRDEVVDGKRTEHVDDPVGIEIVDYFCPHIWGTWRDRWADALRETWDHDYSSGGKDDSGWDWNIRLRIMPKLSARCVFPIESRVAHIGEHGVHMRAELWSGSEAVGFVLDRPELKYVLRKKSRLRNDW